MGKPNARWRLAPLGALGICLFSALPAWAQNATDKATAEILFRQAREKLAAGAYAEACPAFEASQKLDPAVGTLLNLADCYEKIGRTASAWAYFTEVAGKSAATGQAKREAVARQRALALVPRLARISIRLLGDGGGRTVRRDGTLVDKALFGTAVPVDPGDHLIEVSVPGAAKGEFDSTDGWQVRRAAEGTQRWQKVAHVRLEGATLTVEVPAALEPPRALAEKPSPLSPTSLPHPLASVEKPAPAAAPTPVATETPRAGESGWNRGRQRILAGVIGALGLAAIAGGVTSGVIAQSRWNEAKPHCNAASVCDGIGYAGAQSARTAGDASTATFVIGGALAVTAVVLFATAQRLPVRARPTHELALWSDGHSAGMTLVGTF